MDVWFDSGTMPFSQDHYPFDFKKSSIFGGKDLKYPADFISEATDQTRGWFYTLLAVGVLMGKGTPYKNVICLGLILDGEGKKMSKSVGNIVDPWVMIEKYGVDTLRFWMYAVNQPGDSKSFDEKTVVELHRQVFGLLYNVLTFYELYRDKSLEVVDSKLRNSSNILDIWILSRFDELNSLCVENMEKYKLLEPTRAIRDFIGDLSTWYLRRSRDRIKSGDKEAINTLYFILKNLAKIMAPFAPFSADDIWLKLKNEHDLESVHLSDWPACAGRPKLEKVDKDIIHDMEKVREIVSLGLEARQKAGLKVRQPLSKIEIKDFSLNKKYFDLIKDELNVKELVENKNIETNVSLNLEITAELKEEGNYRELVRSMQDMRKKAGLTPSDVVSFSIETSEIGEKFIQRFESEIKKTVLAKDIKLEDNDGEQIKIDELDFKISILK
jgi:isoleucyl-tRNA synthetase